MIAKVKFGKLGFLAGLVIFTIMSLGLAPTPGFSATYVIYPTDDAAVSQGVVTNNDEYIYVCDYITDYYAYLKFDLSSLSAAGKIVSATLVMYSDDVYPASGTPVQIFPVSDSSWTETTITWDNKPAYGNLLKTVLATLGWNNFSVGTFTVPANGLVSFMLNNVVNEAVRFNSKDNATNRPYLLVNTTPNAGQAAIGLLLLD